MNKHDALELALQYAALGIPAFPVVIGWDEAKGKTTKKPLTTHAHKDASTDPDWLKKAFEGTNVGKQCGVGVAPGAAGYVVIDVDLPEALAEIEELNRPLPSTAVAKTASEGKHYWFEKRDDTRVGNGHTLGRGIDVRGDDGWVVAPGTKVELAGTGQVVSWEWLTDIEHVAKLPKWVSENLQNGTNSKEHWKPLDRSELDVEDLEMLELMESEQVGGHSPYINSSGYITIKRPGADGGASASIGHIGPGVVKIFSSGWKLPDGRMLEAESRYNVAELRDFLSRQPELVTLKRRTKASFRDSLMKIPDIKKLEPPTYLVHKWLVLDTVAELFADAGVGKSFLAMDWMFHVATGRDWNGYQVAQPGSVLYIIGEDEAGFGIRTTAWEEQHDVTEEEQELIDQNILLSPVPVNFANADSVAEVIEVAQELKPLLIVIDTLARGSVGAEENSSKDMGIIMEHLEQVRSASGACVLFLHHTGHQNKDRSRGSSSVFGAINTSIGLSGEGENLTLNVKKQKNDERESGFKLKLVQVPIEGSDQTSCVIVPQGTNVSGAIIEAQSSWFKQKHQIVMDALIEIANDDEWVPQTAWRDSSFAKGIKGNGQFLAIVKDLRNNGMVDYKKEGRSTYNKIVMHEPLKLNLVQGAS